MAKIRGIIMGPDSVAGIHELRKTQTRRVVQLSCLQPSKTPGYDWTFRGEAPLQSLGKQKLHPMGCWQDISNERLLSRCPYGVPGDILYVKERHKIGTAHNDPSPGMCVFSGPGEPGHVMHPDAPEGSHIWCREWGRWRSPIFLPKWGARHWLRVESVRVERLRDISEDDAIAEGIVPDPPSTIRGSFPAELKFAELWDSINADPKPVRKKGKVSHYVSYPWDGELEVRNLGRRKVYKHYVTPNPFVWVISFKKIEPPSLSKILSLA